MIDAVNVAVKGFMAALVAHLRDERHNIVESRSVLERRWDPTHGEQPPSETTIEVVNFDKLLEEIDRFTDSFKPQPPRMQREINEEIEWPPVTRRTGKQ